MKHPYGELLQMTVVTPGTASSGVSRLTLNTGAHLHNPQNVVHGGVMYSLADTGMAAALYPTLKAGEICATIDIHMSYFKPVTQGLLVCDTKIINKGKRVAHLESNVYCNDILIARANGNFSILIPSPAAIAQTSTNT